MTDEIETEVAVVGGGPAGLMAAEVISAGGRKVTVYDAKPSVGRKLLMAGRGGLNLTHGEDLARFLSSYGERAEALRPSIEAFTPEATRAWAEGLGQETFVGSSGRVFPKAMKASPLLRAWLRRLTEAGVTFRTRHRWLGWDEAGALRFETAEGKLVVRAQATVLALGGASWPGLGSDGTWVEPLRAARITVAPLEPANCGFRVAWTDHFRSRFEGQPLKRIAISHAGETVRGELMITVGGLEGGSIYALSAPLRRAIAEKGTATIVVDLLPGVTSEQLERQLGGSRRKQSLSSFLRKAGHLSPPAIGLLHEAAIAAGSPLASLSPAAIVALVKAVPVTLTGTAGIARAISTAGGIDFDEIDERYMLRKRPGVFVAGEMLDWEAPTGGYLLQACLSTGAAAGRGVLEWLDLADVGGRRQGGGCQTLRV